MKHRRGQTRCPRWSKPRPPRPRRGSIRRQLARLRATATAGPTLTGSAWCAGRRSLEAWPRRQRGRRSLQFLPTRAPRHCRPQLRRRPSATSRQLRQGRRSRRQPRQPSNRPPCRKRGARRHAARLPPARRTERVPGRATLDRGKNSGALAPTHHPKTAPDRCRGRSRR